MQIHSLCAFKSVRVLEDSLQKKATPETRLFSGVHGPPRRFSGKESACQGRRCRFAPWVRKIPLEKEMAKPTPVFVPGKFHGRRSLLGYSL